MKVKKVRQSLLTGLQHVASVLACLRQFGLALDWARMVGCRVHSEEMMGIHHRVALRSCHEWISVLPVLQPCPRRSYLPASMTTLSVQRSVRPSPAHQKACTSSSPLTPPKPPSAWPANSAS